MRSFDEGKLYAWVLLPALVAFCVLAFLAKWRHITPTEAMRKLEGNHGEFSLRAIRADEFQVELETRDLQQSDCIVQEAMEVIEEGTGKTVTAIYAEETDDRRSWESVWINFEEVKGKKPDLLITVLAWDGGVISSYYCPRSQIKLRPL